MSSAFEYPSQQIFKSIPNGEVIVNVPPETLVDIADAYQSLFRRARLSIIVHGAQTAIQTVELTMKSTLLQDVAIDSSVSVLPVNSSPS